MHCLGPRIHLAGGSAELSTYRTSKTTIMDQLVQQLADLQQEDRSADYTNEFVESTWEAGRESYNLMEIL